MDDARSMSNLVDELFTIEYCIIAHENTELRERRHALGNIITGRTLPLLNDMAKYREFQRLFDKLRGIEFERLMVMKRIDNIFTGIKNDND